MRIELNAAYVLHAKRYRETSLLIELFSRQFGRVATLAKGANRPKSTLRGVLQTFTPLLAAWTGQSDLAVLTAAEVAGAPAVSGGRGLLSAFYVNELLMRLLQRFDPHPLLYDAYEQALLQLDDSATQEATLRRFELSLLKQLGYGLRLSTDVNSDAIRADDVYYYQPDLGAVPDLRDAVNAVAVTGRTLLAIAVDDFSDSSTLREAKRLMRHVLKPHLGDKPLQSRALFLTSSVVSTEDRS